MAKDHITPCSRLRFFSPERDKDIQSRDCKVFCVTVVNEEIKALTYRRTGSVCFSKNANHPFVESRLNVELDSKYIDLINHIESGFLNDDAREYLAKFVFTQIARTPKTMNEAAEFVKDRYKDEKSIREALLDAADVAPLTRSERRSKKNRKMLKKLRTKPLPKQTLTYFDNAMGLFPSALVNEVMNATPDFLDKKMWLWMLWKTPPNHFFITPAESVFSVKRGGFFPLTSHMALVIRSASQQELDDDVTFPNIISRTLFPGEVYRLNQHAVDTVDSYDFVCEDRETLEFYINERFGK